MANAIYPTYKALVLGTQTSLTTGTVKVALVDTANYTYSAAHDFYNDVNQASAVVGTPQTIKLAAAMG